MAIVTLPGGIGGPSGPIALDDLTDVTVPSPSVGDFLINQGAQWGPITQAAVIALLTPGVAAGISLQGLADVAFGVLGPGVDGFHVAYDDVTGTFVLVPGGGGGGGAVNINDLLDVSVPAPSAGDGFTFDGVSWVGIDPVTAALGLLGISSIGDLADVDTGGALNGDVLVWDTVAGEWQPQSAATVGGSIALNDLSDTAVPAPVDEDVLAWDNGSGTWVGVTRLALSASIANNINIEDLANAVFGVLGPGVDGFHVAYDDATSAFILVPGGGGGGATDLNGLTDVTLAAPALDHILVSDGAGAFSNVDLSSKLTSIGYTTTPALDDITDVTITASVDDDVLTKSGAGWVNQSISSLIAANAPAHPIGDLTDVVITAPAFGHFLSSNGFNWINLTPTAARTTMGAASTVDLAGKQNLSEKNQVNGYAGLDANGRVAAAQASNMGDLGDFTTFGASPGDIVLQNPGGSWSTTSLGFVPNGNALVRSGLGWTHAPVIALSEAVELRRGTVNQFGGITAGAGYTVSKLGVGLYRINFAPAFSATPSPVASICSGSAAANDRTIRVTPASTLSFNIQIATTAGSAVDEAFCWVAMG